MEHPADRTDLGRVDRNAEAFRHTDTVVAEFTCTHCNAVPEQVAAGRAVIAIVRHELGCPTLVAQTRTRWGTPSSALLG
jgi:hypothetical protein